MKWNRVRGGETPPAVGVDRRRVLRDALLTSGGLVVGANIGGFTDSGSFAQELKIDELTGRINDESDRAFKQGLLAGALVAEHAVEMAQTLGEGLTFMTPGKPVPARVLNGSLRFADAISEEGPVALYHPLVLAAPEDPRRLDGEMWFGAPVVRGDYVSVRPMRYNASSMDLDVAPGGDVHSPALLFTETVSGIGLVVLARTEADLLPFSPGTPAK
ncbi:MAG TPA: hypothetical protein VLI54_02480 [Bacillota bacterium]|nr:hypothetical protein [Bacillota bacterium]